MPCRKVAVPKAKAARRPPSQHDPSSAALAALQDMGNLDADPLGAQPMRTRTRRASSTTTKSASSRQAAAPDAGGGVPEPLDDADEWGDTLAPFDLAEAFLGDSMAGGLDQDLLSLGAGEFEAPAELHRSEPLDDASSFDAELGGAQVPAKAVFEGLEMAGEIGEAVLGDAGLDAEQSAASSSVVPAAPDAAFGVQPPPVEASPLPQGAADVEGGPEGWSITSLGYVFDRNHRQVGRITRWDTSVSCKCSVNNNGHGSCSLAKSQKRASTGQLMKWLELGQARLSLPEGTNLSDQRKAKANLRDEHKKLWNEVISNP